MSDTQSLYESNICCEANSIPCRCIKEELWFNITKAQLRLLIIDLNVFKNKDIWENFNHRVSLIFNHILSSLSLIGVTNLSVAKFRNSCLGHMMNARNHDPFLWQTFRISQNPAYQIYYKTSNVNHKYW